MEPIDYRSDFSFLLEITDKKGNVLPLSEVDFDGQAYTAVKPGFAFARKDGECRNCAMRGDKVLITLLKSYFLIIVAYFIQKNIIDGLPIDLTKIAAGAICFWQLWSILENESSCNGAKWAKTLQKILVDKTERHFDIDLSGLESKEE